MVRSPHRGQVIHSQSGITFLLTRTSHSGSICYPDAHLIVYFTALPVEPLLISPNEIYISSLNANFADVVVGPPVSFVNCQDITGV